MRWKIKKSIDLTERERKEIDKLIRLCFPKIEEIKKKVLLLEPQPIFEEYSKKYSIPVRAFDDFNFINSFFGWGKFKRRDFKRISVDSLLRILSTLKDGVNEIMCHPGFVDKGLRRISKYLEEREKEIETLTARRVLDFIKESDIELCGWKDI